MPKPLLDYQLVHTFPPNMGVLPLDGFVFAGVAYCGAQPSAWQSTEYSWDNGDPEYGTGRQAAPERGFGGWRGPGAIWIHAADLRLDGGEVEFLGHDVLTRVASGSTPIARWQPANPGFIDASGQWRVVLQDAGAGAILQDALQGAAFIQLPELSAPAVLWVRLENAVRGWKLPPDYLSVRGFSSIPARFSYEEDGQNYIWDWEADVGRRPSDKTQQSQTGAVLWDEYSALRLNGGLQHIGAWSQYISDGDAGADGGPWSALRIAVGDDPFEVGEDFQPAPGAVLNRLDTTATRTPVLIDPLALSVSAFGVMTVGETAGEARLGGTIATTNGTRSAYWHFTPDTSTPAKGELLGVSRSDFVPVCEASLYPNVSEVMQRESGDELMLTHSHLHRYDSTVAIPDALPGLPLSSNGHPGGRCLREIGANSAGRLHWFTEYFGGVGAPIGNDRFAQFYNTLKTLSASGTSSGRGCVFHGDNCAEFFDGRYYGWVQDQDFGNENAQQFLAYLQGEMWIADELPSFPAAAYRWQRLRALSTADGQKLLACGKEAWGESAVWAVMDGREMREASLNFRPRRLTRCTLPDGTERLYAVGRFVEAGENGTLQVSLSWSVIELSGELVKACFHWDDLREAFTFSRADAVSRGLNPDKLPLFLKWNAHPDQPAGGYWTRSAAQPAEVPFLALMDDGTTIAYAPVPDMSALPYAPDVWCGFCFALFDDGGVGNDFWPPQPCCPHAACVDVTKYIIVSQETGGNVWEAIQVSDVSGIDETTGLRKLHALGAALPNLWLRIDSDAPRDDLSSYTMPIKWNELVGLPRAARERVEICVLVPDGAGTVLAPVIDKRN